MKAAVLTVKGSLPTIEIQQVHIPTLGPQEVLIKMDSSPINPSDLSFMKGSYPIPKPHPCIPGFEGSGTVVELGEDIMNTRFMGKRVACTTDQDSFYGCWAEYLVTSYQNCYSLSDEVTFEEGSTLNVNPLTVIMFEELIRKNLASAVIQNAAASSLGKMMITAMKYKRITLINIVRRQEQVKTLKDLGEEYVLCSSDEDFVERLSELSLQFNATVGFDAVGGEDTGTMFNALQPGGTLYVYGGLSGKPAAGLNFRDFISKGKTVKGAWKTAWFKEPFMIRTLYWKYAERRIKRDLYTNFSNRFKLDDIHEALAYYKSNMSAGKVLIKL